MMGLLIFGCAAFLLAGSLIGLLIEYFQGR